MAADLWYTAAVAIFVFVATDLDDLVLLLALFADRELDGRAIMLGQCLGIALLVLASILIALSAVRISGEYAAFLGLAPLTFGLWRLRGLWRSQNGRGVAEDLPERVRVTKRRVAFQVLTVAALTIANGVDNLIAYVPLFAAAPLRIPVYAAVFAALTGAWCMIGYFGVHNRIVSAAARRYGHTALPFVMIILGLWTLSGPMRHLG